MESLLCYTPWHLKLMSKVFEGNVYDTQWIHITLKLKANYTRRDDDTQQDYSMFRIWAACYRASVKVVMASVRSDSLSGCPRLMRCTMQITIQNGIWCQILEGITRNNNVISYWEWETYEISRENRCHEFKTLWWYDIMSKVPVGYVH